MGVVVPIEERLVKHSRRTPGGCLEWTASRQVGYGQVWFQGRMRGAHRVAWIVAHGEIPKGREVDHLCHNRACVEPRHLRLATHVQNGQNRAGAPRHSSTGIRGIRLHPNGYYQVRVTANGVRHSGGYYRTAEEAGAAAERLRAKLHEPVPAVEIPLDMTEG